MFKQWMQKWFDKGLAGSGGGVLPPASSRATGVQRLVPDWQVPAYLRRRASGDSVRR